jgi:hypothetical protein
MQPTADLFGEYDKPDSVSRNRIGGFCARTECLMLSMLPSVVVLGLAALAALMLALNRPSPPGNSAERRAASIALAVATVVQGAHFVEETVTGFHQRFPAIFGLQDIPFSVFALFNLFWLGIWVASIAGLRSSRTWAFFAAWFLSIAGIINGFAHPLLALVDGEYFPGLWSSPVIFGVSVWLWLRLRRATLPRDIPAG